MPIDIQMRLGKSTDSVLPLPQTRLHEHDQPPFQSQPKSHVTTLVFFWLSTLFLILLFGSLDSLHYTLRSILEDGLERVGSEADSISLEELVLEFHPVQTQSVEEALEHIHHQ